MPIDYINLRNLRKHQNKRKLKSTIWVTFVSISEGSGGDLKWMLQRPVFCMGE